MYRYNNDLLTLIGNVIYFIGLVPVNTIFLFKFKTGLRWTSSVIMLCHSILLVYSASPYGVKVASNSTHELILLQMLGGYLVCSVVTGQSDFWVICIFQFPVFIAAAILISYYKHIKTTLILS